jgi:hypothetical protein
MIKKFIGISERFARLPHSDQVGGETATEALRVGNYVSPKVGGRRISVEKHHGRTAARIDVGNLAVPHSHAFHHKWEIL